MKMLVMILSLVLSASAMAETDVDTDAAAHEETIRAALTVAEEVDRPFVIVPLNENLAAQEKGKAVVVADEESWKSINTHSGISLGWPNMLSVRFGINFLKDTVTVEGEASPGFKVFGGGANISVTPLAALGFKYIYVSGKLYGFKLGNVNVDGDNQRTGGTMVGLALGVRIPKTSAYFEMGKGGFNFTREDGSPENKRGWYGAFGISIPNSKIAGALFKKRQNEAKR